MINAKIVSSLEKIYTDDNLDSFDRLSRISVLRGERLNFQIAYGCDNATGKKIVDAVRIKPEISGDLADLASLRSVQHVPVIMAMHPGGADDNYSRTSSGLYPDVLRPMYYGGCFTFTPFATNAVWVEINIPEDMIAGEHGFTISLDAAEYGSVSCELAIEVIDALLPKDDIYFTQWFHADCLANYYNVEVFSDRHFEIIENFIRTAKRNGINMILTPIFTPPLDTAVGGERRTTQLVGVEKRDGVYSFDFSLLDRWIDMLDRCGIKYIEFSHLFTQWGAKHAPKIVGRVNGEEKKLFGWQTDAHGEEYVGFLRTFIPALLEHLEARGDSERAFFHISDEPNETNEEDYTRSKEAVADLLQGYTVMDALSDFSFYEKGVIEHPVTASDCIEPFLRANVKGLWTYYCVCQYKDVSNRYHSMPAYRNRSIGMQMYKYNIAGFLHWGYNFYNNQYSGDPINPYYEQSCDFAFPGGDAFSVYPNADGTALESPRLAVFYEALEDVKAMKLAESLTSRSEVVCAIEDVFGEEITFATCARSSPAMLAIRQRVNEIIKNNI